MIAVRPPEYWPRIEYMALLDRAEIFVIADTFQYSRQSFQNRAQLRTPDGRQWISIPLRGRRHGQPVREVSIYGEHAWIRKHWRALHYNYRTTPFFDFYEDRLHPVFEKDWGNLADLTIKSIEILSSLLGTDTEIVRASELDVRSAGQASKIKTSNSDAGVGPDASTADGMMEEEVEPTPGAVLPVDADTSPGMLKALLQRLGRSDLLVPHAAAATDLPLAVRVLALDEQERRQNFAGFVPGLSALDILFNYGPDALGMIRRQVQLIDPEALACE